MDKKVSNEQIPRCMVVDDNPEIVEIVEAYLSNLGAKENVSFKNANGVLETLISEQEKSCPFNIIILDCNMPDMNGPELLKQIRENSNISKLSVLMMTGEPETYTVKSCFEIGANDFLIKPFTKEIFNRKVESLFNLHNLDVLDFCPIRCSTFQIDKPINFDVYMPQYGQYRILLKANDIVTQEHKNLLEEYQMKKLFILARDENKYQDYLGSRLENILASKEKTPVEKAEAISDFSSIVLKDVYQNLDEINITRLQTLTTAVQSFVRPLEKQSIGALLKLDDNSDIYAHSLRVATLCVLILNKISFLKRENNNKHENLLRPFNSTFNANTKTVKYITEAALLHDIGKITNEIEKEGEDINGQHALWGREVLEKNKHLHKTTAEIVGEHEELCNGKGGPQGLAKHQTNLFSQLVSIASKTDHLLTNEKFSAKEVIKYFDKNEGLYFVHFVKVLKLAL